MHRIERSVLVSFSAQQMFDLVADVAAYPQFMPWCGGAQVLESTPAGMKATVQIDFHGLKQSFTTRNTHQAPELIELRLVDGPFSALEGRWRFHALAPDACKVVFELQYAFSSRTLETLIGPVFNRIAAGFIDAFVKEAERRHGG